MLLVLVAATAFGAAAPIRGLPFTRAYSLEDLGYVPRSARLNFDSFGRLAVIHEGVYTVLDDSVWMNIAPRGNGGGVAMTNVVGGPDGRMYFGGRGAWGRAEIQADGLLHAVPLAPEPAPEWTRTAAFNDIGTTADGVYFSSWNGIVYWDDATRRSHLFEVPRVARVFFVGRTAYVSAFEQPLRILNVKQGRLEAAAGTELDKVVVEQAAPLDDTHTLLLLIDGRLMTFDGQQLAPWQPRPGSLPAGRVSAVRSLVDGCIAVAVTGHGLYLFSRTGDILLALDTPEYHRITALANREAGVLWAATEDAIQKVLYGGAFTTFGQRQGLTLGWPIVEHWNGRIFVASEGSLYEAVAGDAPGAPSRFVRQPQQPPGGAWALTAWGSRLLVGSAKGIFAVNPDGSFQPVGFVEQLAHLVMIDANHCYAVGRKEMACLEWREGRWVDAAPRIPGVPYLPVAHRAGRAVWIEMGGDGVARLALKDGRLQLMTVRNAEWTRAQWTNVGVVGDTVVLSGAEGERRFFDERTETWCQAPELQRLFARSPFWIARVQQDDTGTIWATHNEGLVRFSPKGNRYEMDTCSFDVINDRYPIVRVLEGEDVWISAAQSLSHVERAWNPTPPRILPPQLVSLVDVRDGVDLLAGESTARAPLRLPFARNSVTLRFYSGSDGWRRTPVYEYRMAEDEPWTRLAGSLLAFRGLREGAYRLEVRIAGMAERPDASAVFPFEVLPPWHHTWPAYLLFGFATAAVLTGVVQGSSYFVRKRNRVLEEVVRERTRQLEAAMEELSEETRKSATRAERDRLASEIHDSLQQGLTGAILQLDTTMKLASLSREIRDRLNVVRNMVSYARQEVQHAVWDMESPLLEGTDLAEALRNLTAFVESDEVIIDVVVRGEKAALPRATNHNLLRIAQEATTNALRHAAAKHIVIRLEYGPETVALEITDDGIGFSPDDVLKKQGGHFGLRGIRARAKKLKGQLIIRSAPNQGATVRVVVPAGRPDPDRPIASHEHAHRHEENTNLAGR